MKEFNKNKLMIAFLCFGLTACGGSSDDESLTIDDTTSETTTDSTTQDTTTDSTTTDTTTDDTSTSNLLHDAYSEFDTDNVDVVLSGESVIIETNGLPNHTSPYWSETHELYIEPIVAVGLAPGNIDDFEGTYTLTVANNPEKATTTSATGLGAIGIAVSGSVIYNDEEGPGVALDNAVTSLDYNGAHTGPQSFHYHLEPISISDDDSNLIGVISDGFFLYGRKCNSTGDYPTDLDESGGHTSITQHTSDAEYHYHVENELYLSNYYILFPGNYQGTASAIN